MIRIIGTRIIIPKGDTGFFTIPKRGTFEENDVAVFSVKDLLTKKTVIEKIVNITDLETDLLFELQHEDTSRLNVGSYNWDIKIYHKPEYDEDGILIDAKEINSYYSAFKPPLFIIKEVAKNNG